MATRPGRQRIGDVLLGSGTLTAASLERALSVQKRAGAGVKLGGILLGSGLVGEAVLLDALSRLHKCPAVGWPELSEAMPTAFALLGLKSAVRLGAFPYHIEKKTLRVAFTDPSNLAAIDEVAALTGCRVIGTVTSEVRLMQAHEKFYRRPISQQFTNILTRMSRPRPAVTPAEPVVRTPPPPPRFSGSDDAPVGPTEVSVSPAPPAAASGDARSVSEADPFSDGYSLSDFLGDALAFGMAPPNRWKPAAVEPPKEAEEEPLDPGEPISGDDLDSTRPSRRTRTREKTDVDAFGFGSLGALA